MNKRRILITGGSGLLALNWACAVRDTWDVVLCTHKHTVQLAGVSTVSFDLDNQNTLNHQLAELSPDLVVHTAGLTSVDECEMSLTLAQHANVDLALRVAEVTAHQGVKLIHISTDHLFSGKLSRCTELEPTQPINQYGRTKAAAEKGVLVANPNALILRTNFFGWGHASRQSFSDWLIYNLRAGSSLSLFDNVFITPILADVLALAAHELAEKGANGVFNLVGEQRLSKHEFALLLADHFSLPPEFIRPRHFDGSELTAVRPLDMSLDNKKARQVLGKDLGAVPQFLEMLRKQESAGRSAELLHAVNLK